jgi:hypothetical protein
MAFSECESTARRKENRDGKEDREERKGLHLQLHQGRLPLQSLQLQELQLLIPWGRAVARP